MTKTAPTILAAATCAAALLLTVDVGTAQQTLPNGMTLPPGSTVLNPATRHGRFIVRPASGQERTGHFHTNVERAIPKNGFPQFKQQTSGSPYGPGYLVETPASLGCVYSVVAVTNGCNPDEVTANPVGGSHAIAVVDAYDYSTAAADLATFDAQFGIVPANLKVVYGTGNPANGCMNGPPPPSDVGTGWDLEAALDTQTAHSMAPSATIYLVESNSDSITDLMNAVQVASACVHAAGGGQVSMSFGYPEFSGEQSNDQYFTTNGVTYLAGAGDQQGPPLFPCVSPNVICVGGTSISRSGNTGFFQSQGVWNDDYDGVGTGGGPSLLEARPSYQNFLSSVVGSVRGVPDLAADADPNTGVWVYDSMPGVGGWTIVGGTSLSSPLVAAILNGNGLFWSSSNAALTYIYGQLQSQNLSSKVTNITSGFCGYASLDPSSNYPNAYNPSWDPQYTEAISGIHWNFCAGIGTPNGRWSLQNQNTN